MVVLREAPSKKSQWAPLKGVWVPRDVRDSTIDDFKYWMERTELPCKRHLRWAGLKANKFHTWKKRYGEINQHNGQIPGDW